MKMAEAATFARLKEDGYRQRISTEVKVALDLARDIFAEAEEREQPFLFHTPESWSKKWLPSKTFRLMRLPLNAAAMPCEPKFDNLVLKKIHAREEKPIVVDYNRNQVGKSMHGFVPQVIVIDGKHRFKAAALRGETYIMAWVGELASETLHALGGGGPAPERTTPAPGAALTAGGPGSGRRPEGGKQATMEKLYRQQDKTTSWRDYSNKAAQIEDVRHAPTRPLKARGSAQDASLANRRGTTYSSGKKLETLDVSDVTAGGPGSGRHPGFGKFKYNGTFNGESGYHTNPKGEGNKLNHFVNIKEHKNGLRIKEGSGTHSTGTWSEEKAGRMMTREAGKAHLRERYGINFS